MTRNFTLIICVSLLFTKAIAQQPAAPKNSEENSGKKENTLIISAQLKTRTEFRQGYRIVPTQDTTPAFFTNHRVRLNLDYRMKDFDFYLSIQEARVWGQQDPRTPGLPSYFFEAYAEPHFSKKWSMRIGRQRVMYDDQRLFAENEWRVTANSHDAIRFIYDNHNNLTSELLGAFNQSAENNFTTTFKPTGFNNYKALVVHYLNWKASKNLSLLTLNTMDGYQSSIRDNYAHTYIRHTNGGRLTYKGKQWSATFSAYYQHGTDSSGMKQKAYFLQPEITYNASKDFSVRLGMELMSGQDATKPVTINNNFVPLYGVAHRFNGNMDFFTVFPNDLNNAGLINPYLFFNYQKNKWRARMENHLFFTQNKFVSQGNVMKKYMGFENDWRINYTPNQTTDVEFGFCWAAVTETMTMVKKSGDPSITPLWTYVSFKFTPTLAKLSF